MKNCPIEPELADCVDNISTTPGEKMSAIRQELWPWEPFPKIWLSPRRGKMKSCLIGPKLADCANLVVHCGTPAATLLGTRDSYTSRSIDHHRYQNIITCGFKHPGWRSAPTGLQLSLPSETVRSVSIPMAPGSEKVSTMPIPPLPM